jgi:hypothetical protein
MATYTETVVASPGVESNASAVSLGAILVGAVAAAALSLLLLTIGSGLGLAVVSPWANEGASAESIGIGGAVWLALMQLISAGVGGYLAGRLRTKWVQLHTDEVFFRDTAHGFAVWAVGLVLTASVLASAATAIVGGVARVGAAGVGTAMAAGTAAAATGLAAMQNGAGSGSSSLDPFAYVTDVLLRPADSTTSGAPSTPAAASPQATTGSPAAGAEPGTTQPDATVSAPTDAATSDMTTPPSATEVEQSAPAPAPAPYVRGPAPAAPSPDPAGDSATRAELGRIFARSLTEGELAGSDRAYIARVIADRTGISQAEAEQRVDNAVSTIQAAETKAREAADDARKAAAYTTLWIAIALLIGAFAASYFATVGGRMRDNVRYV